MSCRKSSLAVLCSMVVAGAFLQFSALAAKAGSSELLPGVGSFEISTDATFALQPSGAGSHIWPLLAEAGFSPAPIFDSELQARFAAATNDDTGAAGWDYLWNAASSIPISAVPEPTTAALLVVGAFLLGGRRLRKKLN